MENVKNRQTQKKNVHKAPETLFQLLTSMIIGIFKNSPKMLLTMAIRTGIIFGFIMFFNTYVIAVKNEGFGSSLTQNSPWYYLLNLSQNKAAFSALCFAFFFIVFAIFERIKRRGIKIFFLDIFGVFGWTSKCFEKAGKSSIGILLTFTGIILLLRVFVVNKYLFLTLLVGSFLAYTLQDKNTTILVARIGWSDIQRFLKRNKPKVPINIGMVSLAVLGTTIGLLILNFIPFDKPYIAYILCSVFIILGVLSTKRKINTQTTMSLFLFAIFSLVIYEFANQVFADDGGWSEGGATLRSYLKSSGAKTTIKSGVKPGFWGSLGSLVSSTASYAYNSVSDAGSYVKGKASDAYDYTSKKAGEAYDYTAKKAGEAYDYTAKKAGEAYDYTAEKAGEAYDYIAEEAAYAKTFVKEFGKAVADDFVEAGQQISDFAGKVKDATVDAYDYAKDFANDVWDNPEILKDGFLNTCTSIKDGFTDAANYTKDLVSDVWNNPQILADTFTGSVDTVKNIANNAFDAVYTTITDPKKAWAFVKDTVGIDNFANSIDPNRSLLDRLSQTAIGVFKLGSTLFTAGEATAAIKTGASKAMGFADDIAAAFAKGGKGVKGLTDDFLGMFGKKGSKQVVKAKSPYKLDIDSGPNYTTSKAPVDLSGVPNSSQKSLQYVSDEMGVQVHTRYSNPASKPWIESGKAVPKPCAIKAKTLNPIDEIIGGPRGQEGLVGYFEPKLPSKATLDKLTPDMQTKILKRFDQRMTEFEKYSSEMTQLAKDKSFKVVDGVVHDIKAGKRVAGDVDLFDITSFDGKPLPKKIQEQVIDKLKSINSNGRSYSNVEHGAVSMWDEADHAFDAAAKQNMLNSGKVGGEGVITFNPFNEATQSFLK